MLEIKTETFAGTFPFAPHYLNLGHFQMHYVDVGAGDPVVFLHGDPTWGYLYRDFISPLSKRARCIVPDHMGMGKSGMPAAPYPYRLQHHIANLEMLLLSLELPNLTLVLHDWGGPVGLGFAIRHATRIKRLILMNTWAFAQWPGGPLPRLLEIIRSPRGETFVLAKNGYVRPALLGTTAYPDHLTATILEAYLAPFPTPESRRALLCWSRDIPVAAGDPSYAEMQQIEDGLSQFKAIPVLLVWGMQDPVLPPTVLHMWQTIYPHAVTCEIEEASHFIQEDAPERVLKEVELFLRANP
ncbi:MAG: alpha/beta fold hydrolase [Candidatus Rokubacteria bacterium]|nr:alpha/beta fold hydrolase [Candidatus Rokubacteria bacterium]